MKPYERAAKIKLMNEIKYKLRNLRGEFSRKNYEFHMKLEVLRKTEEELDDIKKEMFVTKHAFDDLEELLGIKYDDLTDEEKDGVYRIY